MNKVIQGVNDLETWCKENGSFCLLWADKWIGSLRKQLNR